MTILLVDDEPPLVRDFKAVISNASPDWEVVAVAPDGEAALQLLASGLLPDLIITDIRMPVMSGLEMARTLRDQKIDVPVAVLSGYQEFDYARTALSLGVFDYLSKPVSVESVRQLLSKVAQRASERRREALDSALAAGFSVDVSTTSVIRSALLLGKAEVVEAELRGILEGWERQSTSKTQIYRSLGLLVNNLVPTLTQVGPVLDVLFGESAPGRIAKALAEWLADQDWGQVRPQGKSDLVLAAQLYIQSHFTQNISGEQLSQKIGIVPSYLARLFKQRLGVSPTEYCAQLRINHAQFLLQTDPPLLIRDIARAVGYEDPNYFSRVYKKITGNWPTESRTEGAGALSE